MSCHQEIIINFNYNYSKKYFYFLKVNMRKKQSNKRASICEIKSCQNFIPIDQVPVVLDKSRVYCITKDLSFNGPGVAISVITDNVKINFNGHTLNLNPISTTGISANGIKNLTIINGTISCNSVSSDLGNNAIDMRNCEKILLYKFHYKNTRRGLLFGLNFVEEGCKDVSVIKCSFDHPSGNGRAIQSTFITNLIVDKCVFGAVGQFMIVGFGGDRNIIIKNCKFLNTDNLTSAEGIRYITTASGPLVSNIKIKKCIFNNCNQSIDIFRNGEANPLPDNIIIEKCISKNHRIYNLIEANNVIIDNIVIESDNAPDLISNLILDDGSDRSISNSLFKNHESGPNFIGNVILSSFFGNTGADNRRNLIQKCIFDSNASGVNQLVPGAIAANLLILDTIATKIIDCSFINQPQTHINCLPVNNTITIDNCTFKGSIRGSITFEGTGDSLIKCCHIEGSSGYGISLTSGALNSFSQNNQIICNNIQRNKGNGIQLTNNSISNSVQNNCLSENGIDGLFIDSSSNNNLIISNKLIKNKQNGINNQGSNNLILDNYACNNGGMNYINVPNVVGPGVPTNRGNIDCNIKTKSIDVHTKCDIEILQTKFGNNKITVE